MKISTFKVSVVITFNQNLLKFDYNNGRISVSCLFFFFNFCINKIYFIKFVGWFKFGVNLNRCLDIGMN